MDDTIDDGCRRADASRGDDRNIDVVPLLEKIARALIGQIDEGAHASTSAVPPCVNAHFRLE